MKVKAFHIDMNNAQFTAEYLQRSLKRIAGLGYNAIIWEVEDNIQWQICEECSSPNAFTKEEFGKLLTLCRSLGLEPVPLLQTIGHCEYVLKNDKYKHLAEIPGKVDQYCPLKDEVAELLNNWIDEYLELFGDVKYFHLGADEAWALGACPNCSAYAQEHSLSLLYCQHLNKLIEPLLEKGIRPIIWADMALRHPETIDLIDRRVVMCDWMYDVFHGCGHIWNWSERKLQSTSQCDDGFKKRFEKNLFPEGEDSECAYVFYTSDYLCDRGFDVIGCPSSSCFGDTIFIPRLHFHLRNCFDFMKKGYEERMFGWALTSWTCHLFPWSLQEACLELPQWIEDNPQGELCDYLGFYVQKCFGVKDDGSFWKAAQAFATSGLFMENTPLGIGKYVRKLNPDGIEKILDQLCKDGKLDEELTKANELVERFANGLALLEKFAETIESGLDVMQWWLVEARNQLNRTKISQYLLKCRKGQTDDVGLQLLSEMHELKSQTKELYEAMIKPERLELMLHWIYDAVEYSVRNRLLTQNHNTSV